MSDTSRNRDIPVQISMPDNPNVCKATAKCQVAFLSAGYGVSHTEYQFIAKQLTALDYLVVAIGHELAGDLPLSVEGNLYQTRQENWKRGAQTLNFIRGTLQKRYQNYDFNHLLLVGHSNGGDISAWLSNQHKNYVSALITLDHRRVPLPRVHKIKVLSIRGSDFPADKGVLPTNEEKRKYKSCIVTIPGSRHNDMTDNGPQWLKVKISQLIHGYLQGNSCQSL
ncbi:alpha/beta hydrolase [Neptunicella marina]|nr:alpha/beta hydrolase [Neptunicella marina]